MNLSHVYRNFKLLKIWVFNAIKGCRGRAFCVNFQQSDVFLSINHLNFIIKNRFKLQLFWIVQLTHVRIKHMQRALLWVTDAHIHEVTVLTKTMQYNCLLVFVFVLFFLNAIFYMETILIWSFKLCLFIEKYFGIANLSLIYKVLN